MHYNIGWHLMSAYVFYGALIFEREEGRDCGGVSTPGHGQGEGPARYKFRDSGTKSSAIPAILPVKQPLPKSAFLDCTVFTNVLTVSQIQL